MTFRNSLTDSLPQNLADNPFFEFSERTHYIPAWNKIKPEHVLPAIEFIIEKMASDIRAVVNNKSKPTYKNTIEKIEDSFSMPVYFFLTLYNMVPKDKQEEKIYDEIKEKSYLKFAEIFYDIFLDKNLAERVIAAVENTLSIDLIKKASSQIEFSTEKITQTGAYYNTFSRFLKLTDIQKEKLKELEKSIAVLSARSQKNMKYAEQEAGVLVENKQKLKGLPKFLIAEAKNKAVQQGAPHAWFFSAHKDNFYTLRQSAEDRELRKDMWIAYHKQASQGAYDNRKTILDLVNLQYRSARLQRYKNPADMILRYQLAGNLNNAAGFLSGLIKDIKPTAKAEIKEIAEFAQKHDNVTDIKPWDFYYYKNKIQKIELEYTSQDFRPYLKLENVLQGVFRHYEKLYGLHFKENFDNPLPHQDVRSFNVTDVKTGEHKGIVFMDLFDRKGKPAGRAWNISVLPQGLFEGKIRRPVDMIHAKIIKGPKGKETLLDFEEVCIIAHELGHATHNILSECKYQSLSGTSVRRDFVEFPSQLNENWFYEPEVLADFALHYKTGAPMPENMKRAIKNSQSFMEAFPMFEYTRKGWLDLAWSAANPKDIKSIASFERKVTKDFNLFSSGNYSISPFFNHIFGGGYEAGFYSYQYAQAMEAQVFNLFKQRGLYDQATAEQLKDILKKGGSVFEFNLFKKLVQGEISGTAMLMRAGISNNEVSKVAESAMVITSDEGIKFNIISIKDQFYTKVNEDFYILTMKEGKIVPIKIPELPQP